MEDRTVHWDPVLQARQAEALAALPQQHRDEMAFMFRTGNVSSYYYNEHAAEPTQDDFDDWLQGLDSVLANMFQIEGLERNRQSLSLRRHAAERNDLGLDQYMKQYLLEQDYNRWKEIHKG
ncbi:hypothetical protein [Dyadobacter sp. CY343]|uniref:hypothetical protein n=1 Tax=Dyadobacter sp. CY343 TaxID=2907299 RepID=UPI001F3ACBBF|nr:hypothetical protein [Dyadobacter sp. CY343]MCE7061967.1 hypothetical protein [Dyadobacter sp. CY343]